MKFPFGRKEAAPPAADPAGAERPDDSAEQITSKVDEALNDPKFMKFLEKCEGESFKDYDVSDSNSKEIVDRFEVFQKSRSVSKELKGLLKDEIKIDAKMSLSPEDLDCVDEYLEGQAIDRGPKGGEYLDGLAAKIEKFRASSEAVRGMDKQIKTLRERYEDRNATLKKVNDMGWLNRKTAGFLNRVSFGNLKVGQAGTLRVAEAEGIDPNNLAEAKKTLGQEGEGVAALEKALAEFNQFRQDLLTEVAVDSNLMSRVQEIVRDKLTSVQENEQSSLSDLDKAQQHYESIDDVYKEGIPGEWQQKMDESIRQKIIDAAKEAVSGADTDRKGQLTRMEDKLGLLFKRHEIGVGSTKTKEEIDQFIGDALADIVYNDPTIDIYKRKLVERVCIKNGINLEDHRRPAAAPTEPSAASAPTDEDTGEDNDTPEGEPAPEAGAAPKPEAAPADQPPTQDAKQPSDSDQPEGPNDYQI